MIFVSNWREKKKQTEQQNKTKLNKKKETKHLTLRKEIWFKIDSHRFLMSKTFSVSLTKTNFEMTMYEPGTDTAGLHHDHCLKWHFPLSNYLFLKGARLLSVGWCI